MPLTAASALLAAGCGLGLTGTTANETQSVTGQDSAGATVTWKFREGRLVEADAADVILGVASTSATTQDGDAIEFRLDFPAGATITCYGIVSPSPAGNGIVVSGTWLQHSGGIFGADSGTWRAPIQPTPGL